MEFGSHVASGALWPVYAEFNDLLTWIRALEERIERRAPAFRNQTVGLLPSLAEGPLKARAAELFARLKADVLDSVRPLTNYVLHASVLPTPMANSAEMRDGRLLFKIPDLPKQSKAIRTRLDLTWHDGLTADSFAISALESVARFVDGLLTAFEECTPERLRKTTSDGLPKDHPLQP